jgi:hypothetical protein
MSEEQIKRYHEMVDENIRTYGYHSTFVLTDKSPSFGYSTGIYESFGIPEIFISSLPQNLSSTLIQNYADKFKHAAEVPLNIRLNDLVDRFPIYLIEVPEIKLTDYVLSSIRFYNGDPYKYVQLIYPDTAGHFPNDPEYDYDQEIMGKFVN